MKTLCDRLAAVLGRIRTAECLYGRTPGSVRLIAVGKTRPVAEIRAALDCGQQAFGENRVQELVAKVSALAGSGAEWHVIGPVQGNKTRDVAELADWVHTIDGQRVAGRLSVQRPPERPPLNVCIQVNISGEATKSGIRPDEAPALAEVIERLPGLRLRGLMTIPAACEDFDRQRRAFAALRAVFEDLKAHGHALDTLSMGMSDDLEAAIAEGATLVRVGTAIFGQRAAGEPGSDL